MFDLKHFEESFEQVLEEAQDKARRRTALKIAIGGVLYLAACVLAYLHQL